jgi:hypothetical protein
MRIFVGIAIAAALAATSSQALAHNHNNGVEVGFLECRGQSQAFVVGSITKLECVFRPNGGRPQAYYGTIRRAGLDIGWNQSTVVHWSVYAPTDRLGPGALAGGYAGGSASFTFGVGVGANALWGGSNSTISLQPVSVQGTTGLAAAAGVAALELVPANVPYRGQRKHRRHHRR